MARVRLAVVLVDFAKQPQRARRTGALEIVNQVMASASVLARVGVAVVHVQFAVLPLEACQQKTF